jgi:hypothetical protein
MIKIKSLKMTVWTIFILYLLCPFGCKCSMEVNTNIPLIDFSQIKPIVPADRATIMAFGTGTIYYLDAVDGDDDTGDGSSGSPWKTLAKSQASCPEGSIVMLRSGSYGIFKDNAYTSSRNAWTVYINEVGETPEFTNVSCMADNGYNLRLIFYGIKIAPAWVDPGSSAPYKKSTSPIKLYNCNYVRFYNCEIVGTNKYLTLELAYLTSANYITFERCHMHKTGEGIVYVSSSHLTFDYNYIHELCASGFKDGYVGSSYITIEGNHVYNLGYNTSDQYGSDATYHGSIVVMNNATTTIRNNFFHDGGGTNAICFYTDGNPVYSNVLIENNLIYNPTATTCVMVDRIAVNVVIRNNIFIGRKENEDFGEYMYNNAFYVYGYASRYNGSGLSIYNNIFVGRADIIPSTTYINNDNNIIYYGSDFATIHSIRALSIPNPSYFESGFFNGALNLEYGITPDQILDLTFATASPGINFGDPNNQPSDCLGTLDTNSEFIIPTTITRDVNHHSVGCYEVN